MLRQRLPDSVTGSRRQPSANERRRHSVPNRKTLAYISVALVVLLFVSSRTLPETLPTVSSDGPQAAEPEVSQGKRENEEGRKDKEQDKDDVSVSLAVDQIPRMAKGPKTLFQPVQRRSYNVDQWKEHPKPLINEFLLGPYNDSTMIQPHLMDAVMMASGIDSTVAMAVHNLYHLLGFRRFIFFVNNATKDCEHLFELIPQHTPEKPSLCFDHLTFYERTDRSKKQVLKALQESYPTISRGDQRVRRNQTVYVSRLGWYLQQFSKMLVQELVPDLSQQYLAIDGDVIFTKPLNLTSNEPNRGFILPIAKKDGTYWSWFMKELYGEDWYQGPRKNPPNFVIGWMVLDRKILTDLIGFIDTKLSKYAAASNEERSFPFNILRLGERVFKERGDLFSEFYTYAHFAIIRPDNPYEQVRLAHPRTTFRGGVETLGCVLPKEQYKAIQDNEVGEPFLYWEEHKFHEYNACVGLEDSGVLTTLRHVGIWHDFHPPPWGGGNQFLLALRYGMEHFHNLKVTAKNDPDGIRLLTTEAQAILANSVTFKGNQKLLQQRKEKAQLAFVHRIDGPYYVARYNLPLDDVQNQSIPSEDQQTVDINRKYACATVFQSHWSMDANFRIGLKLRNPILVPNTINPTIFFPANKTEPFPPKDRKIKIIASSHSAGSRKGFDTMMWVDQNLDFDRFEFIYMGGKPKEFVTHNITQKEEAPSEALGDVLRQADIYFAPSRLEPASNAVLEALASGLPVLYQEGSSHGELARAGGVGFSGAGPELLEALDKLVSDFDQHRRSIEIPTIEDVARKYVAIMRWCMLMQNTILA